MRTNRLIKISFIVLIVVANIGCDQVSKKIVRQTIYPFETIHLLDNHLTVTRVENTGAFLSAGGSLSTMTKNILLLLLPSMAIIFGFFYIISNSGISGNILTGCCFVIGGGVGNIFDRIVRGSVTDFLHINFGIFQTGIFNLADVSIMIGVFVILLQAILKKQHSRPGN